MLQGENDGRIILEMTLVDMHIRIYDMGQSKPRHHIMRIAHKQQANSTVSTTTPLLPLLQGPGSRSRTRTL